jgi:hypothetical protein
MPAWRRSIVVLFAFACIATPAVDPLLLSQVPSDAKMIAGGNLSQLLNSPFLRFLMSQAQSSYQQQLQQLSKLTGFDLQRDVSEFLIASDGDAKAPTGLVFVRGAFDPERILASAAQLGMVMQSYNGVQVLTGKDKTDGWCAFLDHSTAALGDPLSVQGAINRRGAGPGPDSKLLAKVQQISGQYDFWAVSVIPVSNLTSNAPDSNVTGILQGDVIQNIVESSWGIKFGNDVLLAAEAVTRSPKDAAALADVVRFLTGMVQMATQKTPQAGASMTLLQRLDLKTEGNIARISITIPQAELQRLIQQIEETAKKQAAATTAPAAPRTQAPKPGGGIVIQSSPNDMGTVVIPSK